MPDAPVDGLPRRQIHEGDGAVSLGCRQQPRVVGKRQALDNLALTGDPWLDQGVNQAGGDSEPIFGPGSKLGNKNRSE